MQEAVLAEFFKGRIAARELANDVRGSRHKFGTVRTTEIVDMSEPFLVTRAMAVALCDAVLKGELPAQDLETIGFALIASDNFDWAQDDDEPAETFYDWSAPEINYSLTLENVRMFRDRLLARSPR